MAPRSLTLFWTTNVMRPRNPPGAFFMPYNKAINDMAVSKTPPKIATLILLTGATTLSLNMFLPSLVNIAAEFGVNYALVSTSIAGYLVATAVLQVIIGPLSDRYGRRPVMLWAVTIFALASLGCLFAQDIWTFLMFRMLQGAIITGGALARVIVRDTREPAEAIGLLGYISMAMAIAPMLGPMVGGVLDEAFGWRSSFALYTIIGIALIVLTWFDLGETNTSPSTTFGHQFRAWPLLVQSQAFWAYSGCIAFSTGAFYAFIAGVPLVASAFFDMSPGVLGVYMGSITGGFFCGSFVAARLAKRIAPLNMMITGRVLACLGLSAGLILFSSGVVHEFALFGATIFVGVGNGLTMPAANVGVMSVRADLAGTASGLSGSMTVAAGAALTWMAGALVNAEIGAIVLLALMFGASFLGLLSAIWAARLTKQ